MFLPVIGDPYFNDVILHVPMTGDNDGTEFVDVSPVQSTVNRYNAVTKTSRSKWGQSSGYFDGDGDYCTVPDNAIFDMAGDFTIEMWLYPTSFAAASGGENRCPLSFAQNSITTGTPCFLIELNTGKIIFYAGVELLTTTTALTINTWNHFAVVRSGLTVYLFIDGNTPDTATYTSTVSPEHIFIGRSVSTFGDYSGYIQDLRITKGIARWTTSFVVPSGPLSPRLPELPMRIPIQQPPSFITIARLGL